MRNLLVLLVLSLIPLSAEAHDTWVEANSPVIRVNDVVYVDLKLGNHGNDHRDFKLASKIGLGSCTLTVIGPKGQTNDLKNQLIDLGFSPKEGYWSARFVPREVGTYLVSHTVDTLHGKTRTIKSAKTCFVAAPGGIIPAEVAGRVEKPLGHALELVPLINPVLESGPNRPIRLQVNFEGKPLAQARVTFVPRGQILAEGFDPQFERTTGADGIAEYRPTEGNLLLAIVHHALPDRSGDGYDKTQYSASLTVAVPQLPYGPNSPKVAIPETLPSP